MVELINQLTTIVAGIALALALLMLMIAAIQTLFFKQDFRQAVSKMGAIFAGVFVIGAGAVFIRIVTEMSGMIK